MSNAETILPSGIDTSSQCRIIQQGVLTIAVATPEVVACIGFNLATDNVLFTVGTKSAGTANVAPGWLITSAAADQFTATCTDAAYAGIVRYIVVRSSAKAVNG